MNSASDLYLLNIDLLVYVLLLISIKIIDFDSWDNENIFDFVKKCSMFVMSDLINKKYWLYKAWNLFKVKVVHGYDYSTWIGTLLVEMLWTCDYVDLRQCMEVSYLL